MSLHRAEGTPPELFDPEILVLRILAVQIVRMRQQQQIEQSSYVPVQPLKQKQRHGNTAHV